MALVFLMVSILGNGVGAFRQTFVEIPVMLDAAALDKSGNRNPEADDEGHDRGLWQADRRRRCEAELAPEKGIDTAGR
ncbi:MAG: DUF3333 domain-containing protein [Gemmobacter sp.]|nr:DUF3333 domain-containing protein [Gemmobacter sp.]